MTLNLIPGLMTLTYFKVSGVSETYTVNLVLRFLFQCNLSIAWLLQTLRRLCTICFVLLRCAFNFFLSFAFEHESYEHVHFVCVCMCMCWFFITHKVDVAHSRVHWSLPDMKMLSCPQIRLMAWQSDVLTSLAVVYCNLMPFEAEHCKFEIKLLN